MPLTRREMLGLSLAVVLLPMPRPAEAQRFVNRTGLRTGQFVWEPSQPQDGPVTIIASVRERLVHVYKAGVLIGITTCQIGRRGRRTPTGAFIIDGQRHDDDDGGQLAWTGMPLHAAHVRGFPASLGCIRVPAPFARLLDEVIEPGTLVILASRRTEPMDVVHHGALFPIAPQQEAGRMVRPVAARQGPEVLTGRQDAGQVAILISRAGRNAVLLRNGVPEHVARVRFVQPNNRIGTHVYSLSGATPAGDGLVWLGFGVGASGRESHLVSWHGDTLLDEISFEDHASALVVARALHPGAILVITDAPVPAGQRTASDELVLVSAAASRRSRSRPKVVRTARRRRRRYRQTWANALLYSWR